jgi:hypothetical protein
MTSGLVWGHTLAAVASQLRGQPARLLHVPQLALSAHVAMLGESSLAQCMHLLAAMGRSLDWQ